VNVGSGGSAQANFALQAQGVIQGVVFDDLNGNGVQDLGEPGVGGVTVTVSGVGAEVTAIDGAYRFGDVNPGEYDIVVSLPAGYAASTTLSQRLGVPSNGSRTASFGLQVLGVIQGVVFNDGNGNALQDGNELGLSGVVVTLRRESTKEIVAERATSSAGGYRFDALDPDVYRVSIELPAGYTSPAATEKLIDTQSSSGGSVNFPLQSLGSIFGAVFEDMNDNFVRDAGEQGLAGVAVRLTGVDSTQEVSTTADGEYVFRDLTTGNYTVTIVSLDGTGYALEGATLQNVYLAVNGSGSALFTVLPEASIVGKAEPGTDLTLNVGSANRGRSVATVRADSLGVYQFRGLQPGEYSLGITPPPGFTTVQGNIPVMMRGGSERANVEMLTNGTIRGVVFGDVDGNSVATFRENGVGGVTVRLLQNGVLFKESVTAADGSYQFSGLSEGVFAVEVVSTRFEQARVITTTLSTAVPGANLNVDMRQRAAISGRLYRNDTGVGMTTVSVNAV
ncbi:MAG: carboxypeptidase regulatory-like domain-containing protein, partial [Myxococcales bacterium]|nr:carboxypeptidase regulatory-like domain-containing protein [Myxococcales bacterium]